ncbi:hypothetical protein ACQ4M4_12960 [Leptolyngbya sp. AN02str]|uniref:hypothetical protein n=1 Tax=Leptolyngbya sp. AN02str TaxID=3423363 RepID=UPI003D322416
MKPNALSTMPLQELGKAQAKWVQQQLIRGGYLPYGSDDGVVGPMTQRAFAKWKQDASQAFPDLISQGSIELLAVLDEPNPVSEQVNDSPIVLDPNAGRLTGKTAQLPLVGLVYQNQWILPDLPFFTYGEATQGMNPRRLPTTEEEVRGLLLMARAAGEVRKVHGEPWRINSWGRPGKENERVGGARGSTHRWFRGVDVRPISAKHRSPNDPAFKRLTAIARDNKRICGIGHGEVRGMFKHLDVGWGSERGVPANLRNNTRRREFPY